MALKDVRVEQRLTREAAGRLSQLYELWVDNLLGFLQHSNEVIGLLGVVGREEGVGRARVAATPSSPDAVNIVLRVVGIVQVDHKLDVIHICCDQRTSVGFKEAECLLLLPQH